LQSLPIAFAREAQAIDSTARLCAARMLGQARVESDSKDKSLAVTRCNGVPITLGVVA